MGLCTRVVCCALHSSGAGLRAVNLYAGSDHREAPTIFFKLQGSSGGVAEHAKYVVRTRKTGCRALMQYPCCRLVKKIVKAHNGGNFASTDDPDEMDELWHARKVRVGVTLSAQHAG